jgi:hypothetical protein
MVVVVVLCQVGYFGPAYAQTKDYEWTRELIARGDSEGNTEYPGNRVTVGKHRLADKLYQVGVCRVDIDAWGGVHVGKVLIGDKFYCWVPYGGKERIFNLGNYEMLLDPYELGYDWISIEQISYQQISQTGISAGYVSYRGASRSVFVCARYGPHGWDVGKYVAGTCYIPYDGKEWSYTTEGFYVLIKP